MIYDISHRTTILYTGPVSLAQFILRLRPAPWPGQEVRDWRLDVTPTPAAIRHEAGVALVNECRLVLGQPISRLEIESAFTARVEPREEPLMPCPSVADLRALALGWPDLSATGPAAYLYASSIATPVNAIAHWAAALVDDAMSVMEAGRVLMGAIHAQFRYDAAATASDTTPAEAFAARHGVCQDFAHVLIVAARALGIPAAYVSGYLRTEPPPGTPRLVGADAMHAWAALWCGPDWGWIGFDPTNNVLAATDHIFVGLGRDYADVAPLDGVFHGGAGQSMLVGVDVVPREETPAQARERDSAPGLAPATGRTTAS